MAFALEFFLRRIGQGVFIVFLVGLVIFTLLRIAPGDPVRIILGPMASAQLIEETGAKLGLRDPIPIQFGRFAIQVISGDLGHSYIRGPQGGATGGSQGMGKEGYVEKSRASVAELIRSTLPYSLQLGALGIVFSLLIALPIGIAAGLNAGRWPDRLGLYLSSVLVSLPNIWVGVVLIFLVSVKAELLPAIGYKGFAYTILPALVIAFELSPVMIRAISVSVAANLGETYVAVGEVRGLPRWRIIAAHVLRNSAVPLLNLFGAQTIGLILGGLFVVEYIFSYPGLGLLTINAVFQRDFPIIQAVAILASAVLIFINMLVDFLSTTIDRRLRILTGATTMTAASDLPLRRTRGLTMRILAAAWGRTEFKLAFGVFALLLLTMAVAPFVIDASAIKITVADKFLPPVFIHGGRWPHVLGTDQLGRDLFLRSLIGLANALAIGVSSVILMFVLGSAVGILAGYRGGWVDLVLMRITDVQMSIPVIILAITILGLSRPNAFNVVAVLVLAGWPVYARVARSVALAERQKEYVRAAKILGASDLRVMVRHVAPSILPPIAFVAIMDVARMMIFEAIFGFIGIGIQPPTPTLGTIISAGTQYLINAWWITTVPGAFLAIALCGINLMGGVLERTRNQILQGVG